MSRLVGVDIGGTKCAAVLGDYDYLSEIRILKRIAFPTRVELGLEQTLRNLTDSIGEMLSFSGDERVSSIGISCGGPLDSEKGLILSPPNLVGWDHVPIVELLEKKFGIRTTLQNDANACALAEWRFGAAKGCRNAVFLTFGTGMGAGLILDGRLYSGTNGMAGEIGHVRLSDFGPVGYGKAGSFEGFCSGNGITQLAKAMVLEKLQVGEKTHLASKIDDLENLNAKTVADAADQGDELAREIYRVSGSRLGQGLSLLIDILNPEVIVIGSIFARSHDLLYEAAMESIRHEALKYSASVCRIVPAGLGEKIGDFAALAVAAG